MFCKFQMHGSLTKKNLIHYKHKIRLDLFSMSLLWSNLEPGKTAGETLIKNNRSNFSPSLQQCQLSTETHSLLTIVSTFIERLWKFCLRLHCTSVLSVPEISAIIFLYIFFAKEMKLPSVPFQWFVLLSSHEASSLSKDYLE